MKKVEAIIRKSKFKKVKRALTKEGFEYFTYFLVRSKLKETEKRMYRGVEYETPSAERISLTICVKDELLDKVVKTIVENGETGDVSDGRIFVTELVNAYKIQAGTQKDEAISIE